MAADKIIQVISIHHKRIIKVKFIYFFNNISLWDTKFHKTVFLENSAYYLILCGKIGMLLYLFMSENKYVTLGLID